MRATIAGEPRAAQHAFAAALLLVLVSVAFIPYVLGPWTLEDGAALPVFTDTPPALNQLSRNQDPYSAGVIQEPDFALGHRLYLGEHRAPIWNPDEGFGQPFAAGMLAQTYSPLAWIAILWNTARGYDVFLVARLAAAGWFTYLFLRRFVPFLPALGGGVTFAFSGALLGYMTIQDLTVDVMIPALFYAAELLIAAPTTRSVAIAALLFGITTLGGQPEPEAIAASIVVLYWLARLVYVARGRRERIVPIAGASAAAAVLGAGLSAILILPVLEYLPVSWNQHGTGRESLPWGGYTDPFQPIEALRYLAPLAGGPPHRNIFKAFDGDIMLRGSFGCVAAFFGLSALYERARRDREPGWDLPVLFFSGVVALLLLKRFGSPLAAWIGTLPLLSRTAWVKYEEPTTAFAVAVLAGIGIALLSRRRLSAVSAALAALTLVAVIGATMLPYKDRLAQSASHPEFFVLAVLAALASLAAAFGVTLFARSGAGADRIAVAAIAVAALEPLVTWIVPLYYVFAPGLPQSASPLHPPAYVSFLRSKLGAGERVVGEGAAMIADWGQAFGIPSIAANGPLYPDRYLPFAQELAPDYDLDKFRAYTTMYTDFNKPLPRKFLTIASVGHVLVGCPVGPQAACPNAAAAKTVPGFTEEYAAPGIAIFGFRNALPRLALFSRVIAVNDGGAALNQLRSPAFHETAEAVVEEPAGETAAMQRAPEAHVVAGSITAFESRYVRGTVDAAQPSLAVLSDTWFPGWRALVDGREQPILRANYLFRGVAVPAGRHVIEFRYAPASFQRGEAITGLSLLVIAALLLIDALRRNRGEGLAPASSKSR